MRNWLQWLLLGAILIFALALRWSGLDWDDYNHYHPDERYITWVATSIEWPADWRNALDPVETSFNPFYWPADAESDGIVVQQGEARDFAYGHFPLYLGVAATRLVERIGPALRFLLAEDWLLTTDVLNSREAIEFRHLTAVSRALTGLVDAATILVLFLIGRRVYSPQVGLLAATFLALNVMHIQLSHFFTSDPYLAFFVVLALYFMIRSVTSDTREHVAEDNTGEKRSLRACLRCGPQTCNILLAAAVIGLAVGSKFAAVLLFLPLATSIWLGHPQRRWRRLGAAMLIAFLVFFVTNPFAILDFGCEALTPALHFGPLSVPALDWRSCYLQNVFEQGAMVRGDADLGFTRQYAGTLPYLYPVEMQLRWGMGWLLGLLAFAGFAWAIWKGILYSGRRFNATSIAEQGIVTPGGDASLVLLAWTLPFFLTTGSFYVKFMRYLLPLTPFLMLYAAALMWQWRSRNGRTLAASSVLVVTAVYAISFVNLYGSEHPWNAASRWIYANVQGNVLLAGEQWDDSLPTTMAVDGQLRRRLEYDHDQLTWLTGPDEKDSEQKLDQNLDLLQNAGYVTILSNRIYGIVPRLEQRYPLSSQFHQLLFDGTLGYQPIFINTRTPNLLGLHLKPDSFGWPELWPPLLVTKYMDSLPGAYGGRFDESFTVYDQPLVIIFQNVEEKTAAEMRQYFATD
jgi:hypothetical protein